MRHLFNNNNNIQKLKNQNFVYRSNIRKMSEFQYACDKCPRTFKLQEFYDKHKKVHDLKKQHRCHICGFVYGAAKGLEGHIKTHDEDAGKDQVKI